MVVELLIASAGGEGIVRRLQVLIASKSYLHSKTANEDCCSLVFASYAAKDLHRRSDVLCSQLDQI
jgi:hypothetical protein